MPYTTIATSSVTCHESMESLATEVTRLLAADLAKRADLSVVRVVDHSPTWLHGFVPAMPGVTAVEVHITAGTTTSSQRSEFIAHVHEELVARGLGAEPSYVVIHEHDGDAWGFGGITQAARQRQRT